MLHVGGKSKLKQLKTLDWMGIVLFSTGPLVAFCFWEAFAPGLEYPLIPLRLFRNIQYDANVACASLAAIVYYANSIIWPTMVSSLFTTDITKIGWLSVGLQMSPPNDYRC